MASEEAIAATLQNPMDDFSIEANSSFCDDDTPLYQSALGELVTQFHEEVCGDVGGENFDFAREYHALPGTQFPGMFEKKDWRDLSGDLVKVTDPAKCKRAAAKRGYNVWGYRTDHSSEYWKNTCVMYKVSPESAETGWAGDAEDVENISGCSFDDAKIRFGCPAAAPGERHRRLVSLKAVPGRFTNTGGAMRGTYTPGQCKEHSAESGFTAWQHDARDASCRGVAMKRGATYAGDESEKHVAVGCSFGGTPDRGCLSKLAAKAFVFGAVPGTFKWATGPKAEVSVAGFGPNECKRLALMPERKQFNAWTHRTEKNPGSKNACMFYTMRPGISFIDETDEQHVSGCSFGGTVHIGCAASTLFGNYQFANFASFAARACANAPGCKYASVSRSGTYALHAGGGCAAKTQDASFTAYRWERDLRSRADELLSGLFPSVGSRMTCADALYESPPWELLHPREARVAFSTSEDAEAPVDPLFVEYAERASKACTAHPECAFVTVKPDASYRLHSAGQCAHPTRAPNAASLFQKRVSVASLAMFTVNGFNLYDDKKYCSGGVLLERTEPGALLEECDPEYRYPDDSLEGNVAAAGFESSYFLKYSTRAIEKCRERAGCHFVSVHSDASYSLHALSQCGSMVSDDTARTYESDFDVTEYAAAPLGGQFGLVGGDSRCFGKSSFSLGGGGSWSLLEDGEPQVTATPAENDELFLAYANRAAAKCMQTPGCVDFNVFVDGKYEMWSEGACVENNLKPSNEGVRAYTLTMDVAHMATHPDDLYKLFKMRSKCKSDPLEKGSDAPATLLLDPEETKEYVNPTNVIDDYRFVDLVLRALERCDARNDDSSLAGDQKCEYVSVFADGGYALHAASGCDALIPDDKARVYRKYPESFEYALSYDAVPGWPTEVSVKSWGKTYSDVEDPDACKDHAMADDQNGYAYAHTQKLCYAFTMKPNTPFLGHAADDQYVTGCSNGGDVQMGCDWPIAFGAVQGYAGVKNWGGQKQTKSGVFDARECLTFSREIGHEDYNAWLYMNGAHHSSRHRNTCLLFKMDPNAKFFGNTDLKGFSGCSSGGRPERGCKI